MSNSQAQEVIRQELKRKLSIIAHELSELDAVISIARLKGSQLDLNLRTAAIALQVAAR